mmetsp:Transcript_65570/g.137075  ORF Transcript_65570/g.137075 Transcript_65570/m.137075 type:complete len:167 (-) Transcript_65570:739-1239(-)
MAPPPNVPPLNMKGVYHKFDDHDDDDDDVDIMDKQLFDSPWKKACAALGCSLLTCYFLPMLSFIPLVLIGGPHLPNPFEAGYNNMTAPNGTVIAHYQPPRDVPTGGQWYWSLPLAIVVVFFVPSAILGSAYILKTRILAQEEEQQELEEGGGSYQRPVGVEPFLRN